jgi:tRNA(Ile)-lysidine synthase
VPAALPDPPADFSPLSRERHVALAVSGGSDSTALMRLARDWAQTHHPDLTLSVLTIDHGLRQASAGEARLVGEWAVQLGLQHHVLAWEGEKPSSGLQARAREARYGLMAGWCRDNGASLLLTGHTLDDQAETVLMRLVRSLSPDSVAGIPRFGDWEGLRLFRPLLNARRAALRDYLVALGQGWVEDESNADRHFERVRARQELAELRSSGVTPERLAALAEAGARTTALLDRLTGRWLSIWLKEEEAGFCHVPAEPFVELPLPLQQRILARIVSHYGGGQSTPEADELRRLAQWVFDGPVRCTLGGALMGRRKHGFYVCREAGRIAAEPLIVPDTGKALWDGRFLITAAPGTTVRPPNGEALPLGDGVPVFARRAYPLVEQPAGTDTGPVIAFQRITPP